MEELTERGTSIKEGCGRDTKEGGTPSEAETLLMSTPIGEIRRLAPVPCEEFLYFESSNSSSTIHTYSDNKCNREVGVRVCVSVIVVPIPHSLFIYSIVASVSLFKALAQIVRSTAWFRYAVMVLPPSL